MDLLDFNYDLPESLIALTPAAERTGSRLLVLERNPPQTAHRNFRDLAGYFHEGDVLVFNNARVIPGRLIGRRESGGQVEALLLRRGSPGVWQALLNPGGKIKKDARLRFGENGTSLCARVLDDPKHHDACRLIAFETKDPWSAIEKIGHMPLPPYIRRKDGPADRERYQTVFAERPGAVAAPTAGLHFDLPYIEALQARGVEIAYVTLDVSYGTFQPLQPEDLARGELFEEDYDIPVESARTLNRAAAEGRRVIACGTTTVRTLESAADDSGRVKSGAGKTRIFIRPPYKFKTVRAMITNFHLPQSSLLMLVCAFAGRGTVLRAYEEAVREKYRFYSYGDAMLIL